MDKKLPLEQSEEERVRMPGLFPHQADNAGQIE
jgi:hypothetical protein